MAINVTINGSGGITGWSGTTARPGEDIVGTTYDASVGAVCVCRYKFTTDGYGATGMSFRLNNVRCTVRGSSGSDDSIGRMRFAVGTAAEAYVGCKGNKGCAITTYSYADKYASGSLSVKLLPNTVYYLWIFPASNFSGTTRFNLGSCTLKTSGVYGTASSISAGDGVFGGAIPITLSNSVSGVTNTVTVRCGGITRTLAARSAASNFSWSPSLSEYGPAIPNAKSAQATITATTFYGGAEWGSRSKTVTVSFPDEAGPEISEVLLSCDNSGTAAEGLDLFVQGCSRARASITASGKYGASVSSCALSVGGATVSGAASVQTSAPLAQAGPLTARITVTDSRGLTAGVTREITVAPYSRPVLTDVSLYRCDAAGAAADDGSCLRAAATGQIASLDGRNSMTMTVAFKTPAGDYGDETPLQDGQAAVVPGLSPDRSYTARITLTDALGSTDVATAVIQTRRWAMKFSAAGTAAAFGKAPEADKVLEIPYDWKLARQNQAATETHYALFDNDSAWTGALGRLDASEQRLDALEQRLEIVSLRTYTLSGSSALASQGSTSLSRTITRTAGTSAVAVPLNNAWVAVSGSSVSGSTLTVNFINTGTGSHGIWVNVLVIEYK